MLTILDKTSKRRYSAKRHFMAESNRIDLDTTNRFLTEILLSLASKPGYFNTGIQKFGIVRHDEPTGMIRCFYSPMIILMVQGEKQSIIGTEEVVWDKNQYIYIGIDLPSEGRILEATPQKPCLMIIMRLDISILSELLAAIPSPAKGR
jgi:hypothetical protein